MDVGESYDRVKRHLDAHEGKRHVPEELEADVELLVRNLKELQGKRGAYAEVELSDFMRRMMRLSEQPSRRLAAVLAMVAGV